MTNESRKAELTIIARELGEIADRLEQGQFAALYYGACTSDGKVKAGAFLDQNNYTCPCCGDVGNLDVGDFVTKTASGALAIFEQSSGN